ncbi:Ssu72 [Drosophila busckii]|uniref:RNA polymerase II subunit A C-terminal domain phosphatase SSU72 n=2 Tax=Drosophila busckii TaxID=30019 RepID=A0A0M4EVQ6_DROBS|nr:Ssu72 [Drosophila busckii]
MTSGDKLAKLATLIGLSHNFNYLLPLNFTAKLKMTDPSKLSVAVVCSSNMNRSMEAHNFLAKKGFNVRSYGTGERVKLPGMAFDKPNVYEFGTSYEEIYRDLESKDKEFYTQNGLLHMLDRNRRIKKCPERFQETKEQFDIIITVEERVYDLVVLHMESMNSVDNRPVHVLNVDVVDNAEDALMGAFLITDMLNLMAKSNDIDNDIDEMIQEFEERRNRVILHSVLFY